MNPCNMGLMLWQEDLLHGPNLPIWRTLRSRQGDYVRSTGLRFHACRAIVRQEAGRRRKPWRRRVHSVTPSQIVEDRLPRRSEHGSFAKFNQPAGRASGPSRNFRPHDAPKTSPTSAAPGKPLGGRLPARRQATTPSHPADRSWNIAAQNGRPSQPSLFPRFQAKMPACIEPGAVFPSGCSARDVCKRNNLTTDLRLRLLSNTKLVISSCRTRFEARPRWACPKAFL
jgi:hypothetical protein